jgi:hypothetical protein
MAQVVEHLPRKHKTLSLIPGTENKQPCTNIVNNKCTAYS